MLCVFFSSDKLCGLGVLLWFGLVGWTGQIGLEGMGSRFFAAFHYAPLGRGVTRAMMSLMRTSTEHGDRLMKLD